VPGEYQKQGTVLLLEDLRTQRASITAAALRKRLARRFDVIRPEDAAIGGFEISIDGDPLTFDDRQEFKKIEFLWEFGEEQLPDHAIPHVVKKWTLDEVVSADDDWKISGWIGTASKPSDLTEDDEAGSLKNVIVLA